MKTKVLKTLGCMVLCAALLPVLASGDGFTLIPHAALTLAGIDAIAGLLGGLAVFWASRVDLSPKDLAEIARQLNLDHLERVKPTLAALTALAPV